jgi:phenylalanine-4-hydroxylase
LEENQEAWRKLFARIAPRWEQYANQHFLKGIRSLGLDPGHIPHLTRQTCATNVRDKPSRDSDGAVPGGLIGV